MGDSTASKPCVGVAESGPAEKTVSGGDPFALNAGTVREYSGFLAGFWRKEIYVVRED